MIKLSRVLMVQDLDYFFYGKYTGTFSNIRETCAYTNRRCRDWPCWIVRIYASDFATLKSFWLQSDRRYSCFFLSSWHLRWNKSNLADGWILSHNLMALKLDFLLLIHRLILLSPWMRNLYALMFNVSKMCQ